MSPTGPRRAARASAAQWPGDPAGAAVGWFGRVGLPHRRPPFSRPGGRPPSDGVDVLPQPHLWLGRSVLAPAGPRSVAGCHGRGGIDDGGDNEMAAHTGITRGCRSTTAPSRKPRPNRGAATARRPRGCARARGARYAQGLALILISSIRPEDVLGDAADQFADRGLTGAADAGGVRGGCGCWVIGSTFIWCGCSRWRALCVNSSSCAQNCHGGCRRWRLAANGPGGES